MLVKDDPIYDLRRLYTQADAIYDELLHLTNITYSLTQDLEHASKSTYNLMVELETYIDRLLEEQND